MDTKQLSYRLLSSLRYFVSGLMLAISVQAFANPFFGSMSALSGVSDNGLKTEEDTISERQDEYTLSLGSKWNNSLLDFNMGYAASTQTFSEDSQEKRTSLNGDSSLMIGKTEQPLNLFFSHSRTTLLNTPDSVNLTQNQDDKDVFTAKPTLRQRISSVDTLLLNGEYTRIDYRENDLKDSTREGGSLVLQHRFSPLDDLQLSAQHSAIEFKRSPQANYDYSAAALIYSTKLRQLSYSARAGVNKASPEVGEDTSNPSYGLNVAFNSGAQVFSLSGNRELTDTSAGSSNMLPEKDLPTSDGGGVGIDQIERTAYAFNWSALALCNGCTFILGASKTKDNYINKGAFGEEQGWNLGGSYALTNAAKVSLQLAGGDHTYSHISIGSDYKIYTARLGYSYQINRDLGVNITLRQEKRDGDAAAQTYTESFAGAGLNYNF